MKKLLALLVFSVIFALGLNAQKDISGTLIDEEGIPLIGANVIVKETTIGTVTDIDGSYSLTVPDGSQYVVISFTGYTTMEVDISNGTEFNLTMSPNSRLIDEVVVMGYRDQTKPKSNVAAQTVSSRTIEGRPNASLVQTLQGQVAGLNITTSSGQPGANSEINLRGVTSINGNTEPLFIMDGTPVDEDNFRSLNPNEIESISVLKDAGATAIYGNRGANGVIVIKTKAGRFNSGLKIGYNTLVGQASRQTIDYDLMGAQQQLRLEARYDNGRGADITEDSISRVVGTDWLDFFLRNPITQVHNLTISTGSENFNTFTNFGYTDQQGILKESGLKRYNLRTNLNGKSSNGKFRYGTKTSLNFSNNNEPNSIGSSAINRNFLLGAYQSVPYISIDEYVDGAGLLSPLSFANTPLFLYDRTLTYTRFEKEIKALGSVNASYDILDNLTFTSIIGADFTNQNLVRAEGPTSFNALLFAETGNTTPGFQDQQNTQVFSYNWLNSLNYDINFGAAHSINAGIYTEYFRANYETFGFRNAGLDPRTFSPGDGSGFVPDNAANDFFAGSQNANKLFAGLFSYFGNLDYDYDSKYGVGLTVRRDASSRFAASERWGTFYSISGRWNLDQEAFMANTPFDLLKIRGSYGTTGNQRIEDLGGYLNYFGGQDRTQNFFATGGGYGGQNSLILSQIGNTTLKWETVTQSNIGLDYELFSSKLRGAFDYYIKTTTDLFQDRPISAINSETELRANTGSLKNTGFDFNLRYDFLRLNNGFNAEAFFNVNYNKLEVVDLPTTDGTLRNPDNEDLISSEGGLLNEYYVYPYLGVNPSNGNLLFQNSEGGVTESPSPDTDRVYTGKNRYPDFIGSFGLNLSFKGFSLETQFNYTSGVYRFDYDYSSVIDPTSIGQFRHSQDILRAWENPGDITDIPGLFANNLALGSASDRFIFNSDYIRLRFVSIGYSLPKNILSSLNLSRLRVFANAENLTTWTPWRGYDAEGTATAQNGYPTPKVISAGFEVGF